MKAYGTIYIATNAINNKQYIGQTTDLRNGRRWQAHLRSAFGGSKSVFHSAIRTHGKEAFTFSTLFYAFDKSALDAAEIQAIHDWGTAVPAGYNLRAGGGNGKHHKSSREKMRTAAIAERNTASGKARMSEAARKGRSDPTVREAIRISRALAEQDPQLKARRREAQIAAMSRPEVKERHRAAVLAAMTGPKAKLNMTAAMRQKWSSPEFRAKMKLRRVAGTKWVTDGASSKKILIGEEIPAGWRYGRT